MDETVFHGDALAIPGGHPYSATTTELAVEYCYVSAIGYADNAAVAFVAHQRFNVLQPTIFDADSLAIIDENDVLLDVFYKNLGTPITFECEILPSLYNKAFL